MKNKKAHKNPVYSIQSVLDYCRRGSSDYYLIEWEGYSKNQATWEPLSNFVQPLDGELLNEMRQMKSKVLQAQSTFRPSVKRRFSEPFNIKVVKPNDGNHDVSKIPRKRSSVDSKVSRLTRSLKGMINAIELKDTGKEIVKSAKSSFIPGNKTKVEQAGLTKNAPPSQAIADKIDVLVDPAIISNEQKKLLRLPTTYYFLNSPKIRLTKSPLMTLNSSDPIHKDDQPSVISLDESLSTASSEQNFPLRLHQKLSRCERVAHFFISPSYTNPTSQPITASRSANITIKSIKKEGNQGLFGIIKQDAEEMRAPLAVVKNLYPMELIDFLLDKIQFRPKT